MVFSFSSSPSSSSQKLSTSSISTSSVDHSPVSPTSAASLQNGLSSNSKGTCFFFLFLLWWWWYFISSSSFCHHNCSCGVVLHSLPPLSYSFSLSYSLRIVILTFSALFIAPLLDLRLLSSSSSSSTLLTVVRSQLKSWGGEFSVFFCLLSSLKWTLWSFQF